MSLIPIAEIAGISQPAVMCLNRVGINTVGDLVRADADGVAYLLDSYDEAERVIRAARKHIADAAAGAAAPADPEAAAGLGGADGGRGAPGLAAAERTDGPAGAGSPAESRGGGEGPWPGLCERLDAVAIVLEHGGAAPEAVAAALQDAALSPEWSMDEAGARARFGAAVGGLVGECALIQGVPFSARGAVPAGYGGAVGRASAGARRVCAAQALAAVRLACSLQAREGEAVWARFSGGREFCLWYYRTLAGALAAAEPTPLARELAAAVERLERGDGGLAAA